jgi:hypothetical protein
MALENSTKELFAAANRAGYGSSDFSTIFSHLNRNG